MKGWEKVYMNEELLQKFKDPKFYLENFCKIKIKGGGLKPFILNEAQKDIFNTLNKHNRVIILKARQIGFSSAITGYFYHDTITRPGVTTGLIGYNAAMVSELLDKVKVFYKTTPPELRPTIHYNSKYEISFPKMGSKILVLPCGENVGRGYTLDNCLCTELPMWEKAEEKMAGLKESVPLKGKLVIESSPKGMGNLFHRLWVVENEYEKKRYDWWWGYSRKEIEIIRKGMSPQIFEQEYNCFLRGTDVITIDGVKNIEDINVGDYVLTHTNRYRKVLKKFERAYNGDIYKINSFGNNIPIRCTPEHPIRICNDGVNNKWAKALNLKKGDRLTFPKLLLKKNKIISEDLVKVIGWFICEGIYWNKVVNFSLSSDEVDNQKELINSLKKCVNKKISIYKVQGKAINISVNDCEIGELLIKFCGSGATNKKIPFELIAGHEKLLYDTLIKGDGCHVVTRRFHEKDSYRTISKTLVYQIQLLSHMLGYRTGISISQKARDEKFQGKRLIHCKESYVARINKFNPYANTKRYKTNKLRLHKYNVSATIKDIKKVYNETKVYNLEVDVDNSYTANGRIVHNCGFLASGRSVFGTDIIKKCNKTILNVGDKNSDGKVIYEKEGWRIYKEPETDGLYVTGVDVSEGIEGGDYSVATIWDRKTGEEVAMYRGLIAPDRLGTMLNKFGRAYNNALMVVEVNNHGLVTITTLRQLIYPSLYFRQSKFDTLSATTTDRIGWRTTKATILFLIDEFVQAVRDDDMRIHSKEIVDEMSVLVYDDNNNMVPQSRAFHDDCLYSSAIAFQGFKIMYGGALTQLDEKKYMPVTFTY